jgi:hypothetical protein
MKPVWPGKLVADVALRIEDVNDPRDTAIRIIADVMFAISNDVSDVNSFLKRLDDLASYCDAETTP